MLARPAASGGRSTSRASARAVAHAIGARGVAFEECQIGGHAVEDSGICDQGAVARHQPLPGEFAQGHQLGSPSRDVGVRHRGCAAVEHQIAGEQGAGGRVEDRQIAGGMAVREGHDFDLSGAQVDGDRFADRTAWSADAGAGGPLSAIRSVMKPSRVSASRAIKGAASACMITDVSRSTNSDSPRVWS